MVSLWYREHARATALGTGNVSVGSASAITGPFAIMFAHLALATLAVAPPAAPTPEGLMTCSMKPAGSPTTDPTYDVDMHNLSPTLPFKSSYCTFEDNNNLTSWKMSSTPSGCTCARSIGDPYFSLTCHCLCPPTHSGPCTWDFSGTITFFPNALDPQCFCNGEPPSPPSPPVPPVPPPPTPPTPPPPCKAKIDVVIVVDGSASIQSSDWDKALQFTNKLVNGFNVSSDQVEIAVVQFSESARTEIGLSDDAAAIHTAVSNMNQMQLNTNTHAGFQQAKSIFDNQGRPTANGKLMIFLTDGNQNEGFPAKAESDKLKASGVTIFGIGVGNQIDKRKIEEWVTTPASGHYFPVKSFSSLETILQKIIKASCPPHPPSPPLTLEA